MVVGVQMGDDLIAVVELSGPVVRRVVYWRLRGKERGVFSQGDHTVGTARLSLTQIVCSTCMCTEEAFEPRTLNAS